MLPLAVLPLVSLVALSSGQSLADVARATEAQRKANAGKTIVIDKLHARAGERPVDEVRLDRALLNRYSNTRDSLTALWRRDRALYLRVRTGGLGVSTFRDFADVLAKEKAIVELLEWAGFTPDSFVGVEITLRRAERRTEGGFEMSELTEVERANHEFMGQHMGYVGALRVHWFRNENGLTAWPEGVPE